MPATLPLSMLRHMQDHPLLLEWDVKVHQVHECLCKMLREEWSPVTSDAPPAPMHAPRGCFECGGYLLLDARRGEYSCKECGLVQPARLMLNAYDKPPDVGRATATTTNFPSWMLKKQDNRAAYVRQHTETIETMNELYFHFRQHDLDAANEYVKRSLEDERVSPDVRCVASLLAVFMRHKVDFDDVRARMRRGDEIEAIDINPPPPTHACPRCGALQYTAYDARVHPCNWGKKKRPRASL